MTVIGKNSVVTLAYELRADAVDGELIEQTTSEDPFVALFGTGNLIEEFEAGLNGKSKGDSFELAIKSENAYGPKDDDSIREVPKDQFKTVGEETTKVESLVVGERLEIQDEDGHIHHPSITKVSGDTITLDFNHPLAGRDLFFKGEVNGVREATAEELSHGHVHGPGGHHH